MPAASNSSRDLGLGVDVAGDHDRSAPPGLRQGGGAREQHLGVAAVGAADQEHHVGPAGPQVAEAVAGQAAAGDVHDAAAARERDATAGLGGDQGLVADHRDPQPSAGRRAGQHLGVRGPGVDRGQLGQAGVPAVEHVGVDRGAVVGARQQLTGLHVDQRGLGEGRPEVHARHDAPPAGRGAEPPGRGVSRPSVAVLTRSRDGLRQRSALLDHPRVSQRGGPGRGRRAGRRPSRCPRTAGSGRRAPRARCRRPRRASSGRGARSATRCRRATRPA